MGHGAARSLQVMYNFWQGILGHLWLKKLR